MSSKTESQSAGLPWATPWFGSLADMKLPQPPGMDALAVSQRRNIEAITAANAALLQLTQTAAARQVQLFQQIVAAMSEAMRLLASNETVEARTEKYAQLMKQTYERSISSAREFGDLVQKSMTEAADILSKRTATGIEEMKGLAQDRKMQTKLAEQPELMKQTYECVLADTRELAELIEKANIEALNALHKRFAEAIDEMKSHKPRAA